MNLRGTVIPIIDLANKLGMTSTEPNERSAIVVAEVHGLAMGLVVDRVSDILTIAEICYSPFRKSACPTACTTLTELSRSRTV